MDSAKRVVLNTGFLYGKLLISIFISLVSTRLILSALGVENFGIFNLVGGVIAMLSFLNSAMAQSTQRYLSYYLGAGKVDIQKSVFSLSVLLHLIIGVFIVIVLELAGFFVFEGGLNIPENRIISAKIVFQFMIVSTFFTINAVPYDAAINAHENMLFDSIIGIIESLLKLLIAIGLLYTRLDKLILYGLLIASLTVLIRIIKSIYCIKRYEECNIKLRPAFNAALFKEMFSFAGWNLFATFCNVLKEQGIGIILNHYIGVVVNAAYGIAYQVSGQLNAFSSNINKAIKPQIIKSEGAGDRNRMLKLSALTCKLAFYLLAFFSVPLLIEMNYVLQLWLKNVPDYALVFCQIILLNSLVRQLTWGLGIAINSVGKVKMYQMVTGSLLILNLPLAILLMKMGLSPYTVLMLSVFLDVIAGAIQVIFTHLLAGLNVKTFLDRTILKPVISVSIAAILSIIPTFFFEQSFLRLILITCISSISILFFGKNIGMTKEENLKIKELFISFKNGALKKIKLV